MSLSTATKHNLTAIKWLTFLMFMMFALTTESARDHHQDGDEAVEQHEQHADAVDPEVIIDVEALDPGQVLDELHARVVQVEAGVERDRHGESDQRADQRQRALHRRIALPARREYE